MRGDKMRKFNIKNIFFLLLMLVGFFIGNNHVKAEVFNGAITKGDRIGYYYKNVRGEHELWEYLTWTKRTTDGADVYCIQPFMIINPDGSYQVTTEDIAQVANISFDRWDRITKVAYYGYGYNANGYNHTDPRWYAATQMLIWRLVDPNVDSYFTPYLNGPRDDSILAGEMAEINNLVDNHLTKPIFNDIPSELNIEETISLTDSVNVLSNYTITDVSGGDVSINGNQLNITPHQIGDMNFSISKLGNIYGESIALYYATDSQNAIRRGNIDPLKIPMNFTVVGGKIKINKVGEVANISENGYEYTTEQLSGIKFGLFDENDNLIEDKVTNEEGIIEFNNIKLGNYYIQELETLDGYVLDDTKHYIELKNDDINNPLVEYETLITNKIPTGKLVFTKTDYSESETLPNTLIEIYNEKNELVFTGRTDSNGKIEIERLPIGKYYILEKEAPEGYTLNEEKMWFEILENNDVVKATMKDEKIINVPNTYKNKNNKYLIVSFFIISLGLIVIVYGKKKRK